MQLILEVGWKIFHGDEKTYKRRIYGPHLDTNEPYMKSDNGVGYSIAKHIIKNKAICRDIIMCPVVRLSRSANNHLWLDYHFNIIEDIDGWIETLLFSNF